MKRLLAALAIAPLSIGIAFATVNVNSAQQSELQRVKGLDKRLAKSLIEHRAQHGRFDSMDDLEKVPGFTRETIARVSSEIAFEGDPYVPKAKAKPGEKDKARK